MAGRLEEQGVDSASYLNPCSFFLQIFCVYFVKVHKIFRIFVISKIKTMEIKVEFWNRHSGEIYSHKDREEVWTGTEDEIFAKFYKQNNSYRTGVW